MDELVRVSKILAQKGLCSRREADEYIQKGWVKVDGQVVKELGAKAKPSQKVELSEIATHRQSQKATVLLNKPVGYVSGQAEDDYVPAIRLITAQNTIDRSRKFNKKDLQGMAPAGRLDIDSEGLLILTQDGVIAKKLIGENSDVEKEYVVKVQGEITESKLEKLQHGLVLDGKKLKPAKIKQLRKNTLIFILKEGRKRQIRRMCELVGLEVQKLKRVRIGNIQLGTLPLGKWRYLKKDESF